MKTQWVRYAVIAAFACVLGALAHATISGVMQSTNGSPPQNTPEAAGTPSVGQESRGSQARQTSQRTGDRASENGELQNALLQKLWDLIETADDLNSEEKSEAREILEEADPVLARIKKDNERAIEILRNPPRRVLPKRPAPTEPNELQTPTESSTQKTDGNG